jgi:hypothetical protein
MLRFARVAFTGKLASMTRAEASRIVRAAGGEAVDTVGRLTSHLVIGMEGWPLLPDGTVSRKLRRAEELIGRGVRLHLLSEEEFLELAGLQELRGDLRKSHPAPRVCEALGIEAEALRRWEGMGLVRSHEGLYDFQDLVSLRTIAGLVARGVDPATIGRSVRSLASVLPGTERPLCQLSIVVEHSRSLLADLGGLLVSPGGQLVLDFESATGRDDAPPVAIQEAAPASPDEWLDRGRALEEQELLEEARRAYEEALRLRCGFPEAHFNLGNVLRGLGRTQRAEECYRAALRDDPSMAAAWYNLADLQEESGRIDQAIASLRGALSASPGYADAHFNLAACCEQAGDLQAAAHHWEEYLKLDPTSKWADAARRRLRRIAAVPAAEDP